MELITSGPNTNSWFDRDHANIILLEVPGSDYAGADDFQFGTEQIPHLLEAQRQISSLWFFRGRKADIRQKLAFPRRDFLIEGGRPASNWFENTYPSVDDAWSPLAHHVMWEDPGLARFSLLDADEVPQDIIEASVILAALRVHGVSLYQDTKGDKTALQVGSLKYDNINATARAGAVFSRMAPWGRFLGHHIAKAGGARG